jgi:hypothetical protein
VLFTLAAGSLANATIVVPISEETLIEDAAAIVIGHVTSMQGGYDHRRATIFTNITVAIQEVLKGGIPLGDITLRQPGGSFGDLHSWVSGSPRFTLGEKVLLFLRTDREGMLRVAHLYQGKFTVFFDSAAGEDYATRETPAGVRPLPHSTQGPTLGTAQQETHRMRDLTDRIRNRVRSAPNQRSQQRLPLTLAPEVSEDTTLGAISAEFSFMGPARWFEPDDNNPVPMKINSAGEPLAPTNGFDQVRQAFLAWSTVSGSTFRYQDEGLTDAVGFQRDYVNAVSFGDPLGEMDPPANCSGTLAQGGFYYRSSQTRTVNGTTFYRIMEGDLVFNDGWTGCGFYENAANFAEVATHELGHVLGLDHASDSNATMYPMAHFDGRGASLRQDDISGLQTIYPGYSLTVTLAGSGSGIVISDPTGIDCGTDCTQTYAADTNITLTATPAAGSTFTGWSGACSGTETCTVTMDANKSVTATFATALAMLLTPAPGSTLAGATTTFTWTAGTGVSQYWLYVGSTTGGWDLYTQPFGPGTLSTTVTLPTDGRTLYVRLHSLISGTWQWSDYTFTVAR